MFPWEPVGKYPIRFCLELAGIQRWAEYFFGIKRF